MQRYRVWRCKLIRSLLVMLLAAGTASAVAAKQPSCTRSEARAIDPVLQVETCLIGTDVRGQVAFTAVRQTLTNTGSRAIAVLGYQDMVRRAGFRIYDPSRVTALGTHALVTHLAQDASLAELEESEIAVLQPGRSVDWTIEFRDAVAVGVEGTTLYDVSVGYEYDYRYCSASDADSTCARDPGEPVHRAPIVDDGIVWFKGVRLVPIEVPADLQVAKMRSEAAAYAKLAPQVAVSPASGTVLAGGSDIVIEVSAKSDTAAIAIDKTRVFVGRESFQDIYKRCHVVERAPASVVLRCPLEAPEAHNSVFVAVTDEQGRVGRGSTSFEVKLPPDSQ